MEDMSEKKNAVTLDDISKKREDLKVRKERALARKEEVVQLYKLVTQNLAACKRSEELLDKMEAVVKQINNLESRNDV